jgi:zinc/manganese transport system ATP-binding protein
VSRVDGSPRRGVHESAPDDGGALIELRDAAVELGGRRVWAGVTLSVAAGEFVAVLGPNGAGKSTLLKALLGLVPATAGSVRVAGRTPRRGDHQIGYLPQRRSFDPGLAVRGVDIVRLGVDGDRWGLPVAARRGAARARVAELLDLVGARDLAQRPIGALSGGEQQRILIAQALARRPRLLLLDEPLDSLDLPNQAGIAALIADLCREEGVAVLIVAHDVNPVLSYVDRVLYVAGGSALVGRPEDVITGPALTQLYGAPIEVLQASDGRLVVVGQPEAASYHPQLHPHEVTGGT